MIPPSRWETPEINFRSPACTSPVPVLIKTLPPDLSLDELAVMFIFPASPLFDAPLTTVTCPPEPPSDDPARNWAFPPAPLTDAPEAIRKFPPLKFRDIVDPAIMYASPPFDADDDSTDSISCPPDPAVTETFPPDPFENFESDPDFR